MIVQRDKKHSKIIPIVIIVVVGYIMLKILTYVQNAGYVSLDVLTDASNAIFKVWEPINWSVKNILISLLVGVFVWAAYECIRLQNKKNIQEYTHGSAEWQDASALEKKKSPNIKDNIILTATEQVSKKSRVSGMNRHVLIVGRPGTGKSRYFFKPNLLNATGTIVCTDPKGELIESCAGNLKRQGYDIRVLNLDDKTQSNHYNPFLYIRTVEKDVVDEKTGEVTKVKTFKEDDVMSLIDCIMRNTASDQIKTQTGDPFWEKAEMLYLQAITFFMLEQWKDEPQKKNFTTILELIRKSAPPDNGGDSELDEMFHAFEREYTSDHIAVRQWKHFKVSASSPKTMSTIIMTATARLSSFNIEEIAKLTNDDSMELNRIGMPIDEKELAKVNEKAVVKRKHGRVAYFIITKPSDPTFNFIGTIMYSQMFQQIDENAKLCGGSLATSLDMYMDEFRQQGEIPRFQEMLAYVRSLNVGIVICLQSLSQLKVFYKDDWENILDCCDTIIDLGSNSKETNEYFSTLLGEKTWYKKSSSRTFAKSGSSQQSWDVVGRKLATLDELAKLDKGYCVMFISNIGPFYSKLYDLTQHPDYKYIYEPWDSEHTIQNRYIHDPYEVEKETLALPESTANSQLQFFKNALKTDDVEYVEEPLDEVPISVDDFNASNNFDDGDIIDILVD